MEAKRPVTSTPTDRARTTLAAAEGRATAAQVVIGSALDVIDNARAQKIVLVSEVARERLGRLALEIGAKTNEFRRQLEELLADQ